MLTSTTSDWALPDQLVFSTVSALLRITSIHTEYSETAANAIFTFIAEVIEKIKTASCEIASQSSLNSTIDLSIKLWTS